MAYNKANPEETEGYQITILGRHVEVTEPMKQYALEKVAKIERFSKRIIEAIVTMDIIKLEHHVDIVLKVDHTKIKVAASSENMYASIDKATDRLQRKLWRYKTRLQDHHAKALPIVDMMVNVLEAADDTEDINNAIEEENERRMAELFKPATVIAKETRPLKQLTTDEAIMKLQLSEDRFLPYRDEARKDLRIVYQGKDGNYRVIELE